MMKGGKEEDKIAGPLFPRLHVNDADKGGPRAPPRNKMALYEQLSIPSQRFNQTTASAMPLPPYNGSTLLTSASSSQGGGHKKSESSSFYIPQSATQSAEMVQSRSFDGENLKSTRMEFGRSVRHANHRSSDAAGSVAECSSLRPHDLTSAKNTRADKFDDDDFMVPTFVHSGAAQTKKDTHVMETNRLTPLRVNSPQKSYSATLNSSIRFSSSYDKPLEQVNADKKSRKHERDHTEQKSRENIEIKENKEKSVSHRETREDLAEASYSSNTSSDQENISIRNVIKKTRQRSIGVFQQSSGNVAMDGPRCLNDIDVAENGDDLRLRSETCSKASFGNNRRSTDMAEICNRGSDDKKIGSVELKVAGKNDEVSDTSVEDSLSGLEISPDDVVGIIGPKQFWKARRAIVNQQRVFAVQVFELHRLIKVQKLIAASPHLLLEDNAYLSGSPQKVPNENPPPESSAKPQPQIVKQKDETQKLNQKTECQKEKNTRAPPLPSPDDGLNRGLHQLPRYGPYSGNPSPPVPVAPESRPSPWCYPAGNHWLVPVMSPSEGLIYKPYTGPCPTAPGFMSPVYGSCGPLSMPPVAGDFMNAAYGVAATHQPQNMGVFSGAPAAAPNYFPNPYGLPVMNPNISASAVEQVNPMTGTRPTGEIEQRSRNSCNNAIPRSEALSGPMKFHTSKDSEFQGSTASSPCERAGGGRDPLPLFPMATPMECSARTSQSHGGDHQTRVIKVVPHNPRSATESAARIFRSIQEERQQGES